MHMWLIRLAAIIGLAVSLGACVSAIPFNDASTNKPASRTTAALDVAMVLDNPRLGSDPVVRARFSKVESKFVVDTGTSHLLVTDTFARQSSIPGFRDGLNRQPLRLLLGEYELHAREFFVVSQVPHFDSEGWGGIISPQKIDTSGYVVLDFPGQRLLVFDRESRDAAFDYVRHKYPTWTARPVAWLGREYGAMLTRARVGQRDEILIDMDSGKAISGFLPGYLGDVGHTREGPKMMDISGNVTQTRFLDGQQVTVGPIQFTDRTIAIQSRGGKLPNGMEWKGNLGMDFLGSMVLIVPPEPMKVVYLVSA